MKSRSVPIMAITLFGIMLFSQAAHAQNKINSDSLEVLKKQITELEIKTKLQQEKINMLEGLIGQLNAKKPFAVFPSDPQKNNRPKSGSPFQFNGNTYYFVPLIGKYITNKNDLEKTKNDLK